jgi:hypothetical protein
MRPVDFLGADLIYEQGFPQTLCNEDRLSNLIGDQLDADFRFLNMDF